MYPLFGDGVWPECEGGDLVQERLGVEVDNPEDGLRERDLAGSGVKIMRMSDLAWKGQARETYFFNGLMFPWVLYHMRKHCVGASSGKGGIDRLGWIEDGGGRGDRRGGLRPIEDTVKI
jgi:hypothetical protein